MEGDLRTTDAGPAAPAPRPGERTAPAESYWLSSLELLGGVDVEVVGVRAVPTEALREFLRMREAWRQAGRPPADRRGSQAAAATTGAAASLAAAGAASPRVPSDFELDISLESDGRVTLPGDLLPADG